MGIKSEKGNLNLFKLVIPLFLIIILLSSVFAITGTNIVSEVKHFIVNERPTISNINIDPSSGTTLSNFTCDVTSADVDGDSRTHTYFWSKDSEGPELIMDFDQNISTNKTDYVKDLSGNNNNGTLGSGNSSRMPMWVSSGKSGGAYQFSSNTCIDISSFNPSAGPVSISVWFNTTNKNANQAIIGKTRATYETHGFGLTIKNSQLHGMYSSSNDEWYDNLYADINNNQWHHAVLTFSDGLQDTALTNVVGKLYLDGNLEAEHTGTTKWYSAYEFFIGASHHGGYQSIETSFIGSIDEARVYPRELSAQEVMDLYHEQEDELNMNTTNKSNEWTCSVVAFDGYEYSDLSESSSLIIDNTPPEKPVLVNPTNANVTLFSRTPQFFWTANDIDNDNLTFILNISHDYCSNLQYPPNGAAWNITNLNYTITDELCVDYETSNNNTFRNYTWRVKAFDGEDYSEWSDPFTFLIESSVIINKIESNITFGNLNILDIKNTDNDTNPFVFINVGNVKVDLYNSSLTPPATQFWNSVELNHENFQIKADNYSLTSDSNYNSSFNSSLTVQDWINFSSSNINLIKDFDYHTGQNYIEVDIQLKVPGTEPPGSKLNSLSFYWALTNST